MIVAVTGVIPVFTAVNEGMLPDPLAARPIDVLLLVQLNTVPATAPVKLAEVVEPLHTTWFATASTVGVGFTVIVNVRGVPVHAVPETTSRAILSKAIQPGPVKASGIVSLKDKVTF